MSLPTRSRYRKNDASEAFMLYIWETIFPMTNNASQSYQAQSISHIPGAKIFLPCGNSAKP
jgi:hypothetical protein